VLISTGHSLKNLLGYKMSTPIAPEIRSELCPFFQD
jgi:hypothetical protein